MKNIHPAKMIMGFAFCIYIISGCSKTSSSNNQCNITTGSIPVMNGALVRYSATGTGTTSLSSISFLDSGGLEKVSNPSLPWSKTISFNANGSAGISAIGTASNGGIITLSYGLNYAGTFTADTVACSH